jgi:predicted acylesterase/phospholipase RssA
MMPYHIGVAHRLVTAGRIRSYTKFAGASGGSLMGAYLACAVDPEAVMDAQLHQAEVCYQQGTWWKLRRLLKDILEATLPDNAHEYCNGRLTVAVTRLWPQPRLRPIYIQHFEDKDDLISALLASCMVPTYLEASLVARFRNM